jgi:hypothetical protein
MLNILHILSFPIMQIDISHIIIHWASFDLSFTTLGSPHSMSMECKIVGGKWFQKDLERSGRILVEALFWYLPIGTEKNHEYDTRYPAVTYRARPRHTSVGLIT